MAVHFQSNNPTALLSDFKKKIDQKHIVTWSYTKDGDFTHATDQWKNKAWLRPSISSNQLILSIVKPQGQLVSREVYGIYQGRFIESMLTHCYSLFTNGSATALASGSDIVSAA